jgi:hypothetical protein
MYSGVLDALTWFALARFRPAMTRSRIIARSNSANGEPVLGGLHHVYHLAA